MSTCAKSQLLYGLSSLILPIARRLDKILVSNVLLDVIILVGNKVLQHHCLALLPCEQQVEGVGSFGDSPQEYSGIL